MRGQRLHGWRLPHMIQSDGVEFPSKNTAIFLPFSTPTDIVYNNQLAVHFRYEYILPRTKQNDSSCDYTGDFNVRLRVVVNSVCAVSVTLSSRHLFPLESTTRLWLLQRPVQCTDSPFACLNNTLQLWEVRQGAKVQFTYGTQQHKSLWFTEKGHELIITKLTLRFSFSSFSAHKSPPCVSVRRGLAWFSLAWLGLAWIGSLCLMTKQKMSGQQTHFWMGHKL